jgi:hypothetical protein
MERLHLTPREYAAAPVEAEALDAALVAVYARTAALDAARAAVNTSGDLRADLAAVTAAETAYATAGAIFRQADAAFWHRLPAIPTTLKETK